MKKVLTGLDIFTGDKNLQNKFKGNVALLCHNASIDSNYEHAAYTFKTTFGSRFIKLFGPQHGFSTDARNRVFKP